MTKQCYKCNKTKSLELFHQQFARWTTKDGIKHKTKSYTNLCKVCKKEYDKNYHDKYYQKNKKKMHKQNKKWIKNNP